MIDDFRWGLITLTMFGICLPVDVLIFYKEPLGAFGTLFVTIWVLIPFLIMVADATFPEKEAVMVDKCRLNNAGSMALSCLDCFVFSIFCFSWQSDQNFEKLMDQASVCNIQ